MFTESDAEQFTEAYLNALVWSSDDESQEWREAQASDALRERARIEARAFLYRAAVYIDAEPTAPGMARHQVRAKARAASGMVIGRSSSCWRAERRAGPPAWPKGS